MSRLFPTKAERDAYALSLDEAAIRRRGLMTTLPGIGHSLAGVLAASDGRYGEGIVHHGLGVGIQTSARHLTEAALAHRAKHLKYKGLLPVVGAAGVGAGGLAGYLIGKNHDK